MSPSGIPAAGMLVSTGVNARTGSWRQEDSVNLRASSGTGGPFSWRAMMAAEP